MKELNKCEIENISGGLNPVAIAGAIWLGLEIFDALYTAGKAFGEGYNEVRN